MTRRVTAGKSLTYWKPVFRTANVKSFPPIALSRIPVELQLLVCCIRNPGVMSDENRACIRQLVSEQDPDWHKIISLAERHRVLPFLHDGLRSAKLDDVPSEPWQRIHKKYLSNAVINAALVEEIVRLQELCRAHDIDVLPFKGPILARALYGDITYRTCDDLDFLVRHRDIDRARRVFLEDGFVPHIDMTESEQSRHRSAGWEYMLRHPDMGYLVELDTCTGPRFQEFELPSDEIFEEPVAVHIDNEVVYTVNPEVLLLMLCVHGPRHDWDRLTWVTDILAIWRAFPDMSFERISLRAGELGAKRMLLLGHALAGAVAGSELSGAISEAISHDSKIPGLVEQCIRSWTRESKVSHSRMRFRLAVRERLRDRVLYVLRIACTPSYGDWKAVRLPRKLYALYYVIRPFRLALKALAKLLQRR
ncbi:MAG: nucleotidyltransferase family protein [Kiritimatiellia bacterium]|nr:nucleotidyltransferase family protein [Kiritimatiellia bacterium]